MKRPLFCVLLVLATCRLSAQKINVDSLIKIAIATDKNDENVIPRNPDSLLKMLFLNKSPAARIRTVYDIILLDNGELNVARALYYHHKILEQAKQHHDPIVEAVITGELGYTLYQGGDSPEGLKMMFDALKLAEKTGNKQAIGTVYDNLGVCTDDNDYKAAIGYYKKAFKYSTEGGDNLFACVELGNLGRTYVEIHAVDTAIYFFEKSFDLARRIRFHYEIIRSIEDLGLIQTDHKLKLKYFRYALMMAQSPRDGQTKGSTLLDIARVYQQENKTDSALLYTKKAYGVDKSKFLSRILTPAQLLAQLYTGKNADSALKYTKIYYNTRDSLYSINKVVRAQSMAFAEQQRQQELTAQKTAYQTTLRLYLMAVVTIFLLALAVVFWRNNRRNKKANQALQSQKEQIQNTLLELKQTQTQLIQSEKMASLGELTAGIAHEIQNPLNFVNNFSEVSMEMIDEMQTELRNGDKDEAIAISEDIKQNLEKIRHHGKRADGIVKGMLQHSRATSNTKEPTDINKLADEYLRLAYHGLRAKDKSFNAELVTNFAEGLPSISIVPQDIGRVLLNLFNNAFYATQQKAKANANYKPEVVLVTSIKGKEILISVKDNGNGIPEFIKDKIMQPFFTTKPTGEGTGLGLSLSYDIVVKGHGGEIKLESKEGEFTAFTVILPQI